LGPGQPLLGQEHVTTGPHHEAPAAGAADPVADAVPGDGRHQGDQPDQHHVQPAVTGVDPGDDQQRLRRHGDTEALHQHQPGQRQVAVVVEYGGQFGEGAWQVSGHCQGYPAVGCLDVMSPGGLRGGSEVAQRWYGKTGATVYPPASVTVAPSTTTPTSSQVT